MAFNITSYVDPGVFVRERIQPGSVTVTSERVMGLIGLAPRTRRTTDEAVVRGTISGETLTLATSTPYIDTLSSTSNRNRNSAILYRNGQALGLGDWSFNPASLTGGAVAGASLDTSVNHLLTISMDGKEPTTLELTTQGLGTAITTIASELNTKLAAVTAYGATYNSVFSTTTTTVANDTLVITSPVSTSVSDIKIFLSLEDSGVDEDMASEVSATTWVPTSTAGVQASTVVKVNDNVYDSTSTYTIDYVSIDNLTDALVNASASTPLSAISRVGSFPGGSNYANNTDFEKTGNTVDWDLTSLAQATVSGVAGTYNISSGTTDSLVLSLNGLAAITITLTNGAAVTAATLAVDINTALNGSTTYGPEYAYVASDSSGTLVLTAPLPFDNFPADATGGAYKGTSSSIRIESTSTCGTVVFGLAAASLPAEYAGIGSRPAYATVYYTTYDYTRSSDDYNSPVRVYNPDQLYEYTSPLTLSNYARNSLAVGGEIAFENGASSLYVVQINDSTSEGFPTQNQVNAAIDAAGESSVITDVIVLDHTSGDALTTDVYLMNHVATQSSLLEKKYRRGWFGMPRGTAVGDPDTPDTFVYRAVNTLQPGNTSPARGRLILCAPSEASRTLTLEDSREITVELDGKYLAVADAAKFVSLSSPSDALLGQTITGFLTDSTFETYLQGERYTLAGNGVNVNTLDAGVITMLDPLTTEAGGGGVVQFEEPSSSAQKDAVVRAIETVIDVNVKGIVPDDLADFIVDIKTWISLTIKAQINAGVIAPYRTASGATREIDLVSDIQVFQDSSDPRNFTFKFWFNLKYVAKRFFGEYSVDNPFFAA